MSKKGVIPMKQLMMQEVRKVRNHSCTLPEKCDLLMSHYIFEGYFVGLRRRFRYFLLSSPNIPESKIYLKSTAEIDNDHLRHLKKHYYMIHPFSEGRFVWEVIMTVVFTILFIMIPCEVMQMQITRNLLAFQFCLDSISWTDIFLHFVTGYMDVNTAKVVLDKKKICKRYVTSYFVFDVISSLPIKGIVEWTQMYTSTSRHIKLLLLLKVVRLPTYHRYLKKVARKIQIPDYIINFSIFLTSFMVLLAWSTCVALAAISMAQEWSVETFSNNDLTLYIIQFFYETVAVILLVGPQTDSFKERQPKHSTVYILYIFLLLLGSVLSMVILAQVTRIYTMYTNSNNKYSLLTKEIKEYSHFKGLSPDLEEKVLDYVDFKYQKNITDEATLLKNLSTILKEDLLFHNCQRLISKVVFFQDMPEHVTSRLVTKFKPEIFMPGDTIVQANTIGNCMYFIYSGTVAVYTETWKEIVHLNDGDNFGEIALLLNAPRVANVVAVTECELFKLYRKDFQEVIDPYPELRKNINILANERFQDTTRLSTIGTSAFDI